MSWELALLSATGAVAIGTATLMSIMYFLDKKPFLAIWSASWVLFLACIITLIVKQQFDIAGSGIELYFYLLYALLQFFGTRSYVGHPMRVHTSVWLIGIVSLLSIGASILVHASYYGIGMNVLAASVFWMTAWTVFRARGLRNTARYSIFFLFLVVGFHQLSQSLYIGSDNGVYVWYSMHLLMILTLSPVIFWIFMKTSKEEMGDLIDRYEKAFSQNHAIMLLIDPSDTRILDCNKAATDFYGYDAETLKTMKMIQINLSGPIVLQECMNKALATGQMMFHFQHRIADGSVRQVEVVTGPLRTKGKTVLLSIIRDITETMRNEKLHETEKALLVLGNQATSEQDFLQTTMQQLQLLGELGFVGMYFRSNDRDGDIVRMCAEDTDQEIIRVMDDRRFIEATLSSIQSGNAHRVPDMALQQSAFALLPKDRIKSLVIEPIFNNEVIVGALIVGFPWNHGMQGTIGNFLESLSFLIGSTLRRLHSDFSSALTESRWRFALEGIGDLVLEIEADGRMQYPSANTERVLGYTLQEMPLQLDSWMQLVQPEDRQLVEKTMLEEVHHHQIYAIEHRLQTKTGDSRWFMHRGCVIRHPKEGKSIIMAILTDIHSTKEFAVELLHAKEELEQANSIKSLFLANMSHELRTPMNGIFGMLQLLEISNLDADQRESLSIMRDSSKRMMGLINNLITYTTIEGGSLSLHEDVFDLGQTVRDIAEEYRYDIQAKELKLNLDISDKLPQNLFGDAEKIGMILTQWLDNAVKFTDAGSIAVTLKPDVPLASTSGQIPILLTVADTGIGITKNNLPGLFKNFTQADNSYTRTYQGAGLGLAICRQVGEMLGASFDVDSAPGEGSVFKMRLRLKKVRGNHIPSHENSGQVLVVDDDEVSRRLLGLFCEKADMAVQYAANGREAILKNAEHRFDLIFMDIQMPDMSGVEATKIIKMQNIDREMEPNIIAVTAYALKGDQERFLQEGMDDYLSKPIDSGKLFGMMKKWMTKRRSALQ